MTDNNIRISPKSETAQYAKFVEQTNEQENINKDNQGCTVNNSGNFFNNSALPSDSSDELFEEIIYSMENIIEKVYKSGKRYRRVWDEPNSKFVRVEDMPAKELQELKHQKEEAKRYAEKCHKTLSRL